MPQWLDYSFLINLTFFLAGALLSYILYLKAWKVKRPIYAVRSFHLTGEADQVPGLEIKFFGKEIKSLSGAYFVLWNGGNEAISQEDIAPTDKLRIEIDEDHEILNAEILYIKKRANNFSISLSENRKRIDINFDYFHRNEGVKIFIFHTAKKGEALNLLGTIKGAEEILNTGKYGNRVNRFMDRVSSWAFSMKNEYFSMALFGVLLLPAIPISMVLFIFDIFEFTKTLPPKEYKLYP